MGNNRHLFFNKVIKTKIEYKFRKNENEKKKQSIHLREYKEMKNCFKFKKTCEKKGN